MADPLLGPGVTLVLLRRKTTSTDVMLVPSPDHRAALPCASACRDKTQWTLAEELLRENRMEHAGRLYASTLSVERDGAPHGIFVAFVDDGADHASTPATAHWMDLREACRELAPLWCGALSEVRERFIAHPPDEALRLR